VLNELNLKLQRMMEAARTSETSVDNYFTRQYIPEDNSELHTRRCENLKSHNKCYVSEIQVLAAANMKMTGFWDIEPYTLVSRRSNTGGTTHV
jgi:hypothetical protein